MFTELKNGHWQCKESKQVIAKMAEEFRSIDGPIVRYVPGRFFKYKKDGKVVILGCTPLAINIVKKEDDQKFLEPIPKDCSIEDLVSLVNLAIMDTTFYKDIDTLWVNDITIDDKETMDLWMFVQFKNDNLNKHMKMEGDVSRPLNTGVAY